MVAVDLEVVVDEVVAVDAGERLGQPRLLHRNRWIFVA